MSDKEPEVICDECQKVEIIRHASVDTQWRKVKQNSVRAPLLDFCSIECILNYYRKQYKAREEAAALWDAATK